MLPVPLTTFSLKLITKSEFSATSAELSAGERLEIDGGVVSPKETVSKFQVVALEIPAKKFPATSRTAVDGICT